MTTPVRVRFAPSPTGEFHVGGGRSALWNWLFARQHDGVFVLRIEDTDEARNQPEWIDGIRSAMRWLQLDWDEEYLQSANVESHLAAAKRLLDEDKAYYDDGAVRFRVPEGTTVIDDVVRGRVEFENDKIGGDFVIVKSTGAPLFYLANTVDDLDEGITHVLRAEEHLPNAPKNQLLWTALTDAPPPTWAHLPLLVNERRQKISKRMGDQTALESYRDQGFLMEAIRNYLCLLGWAPSGDREFLTLDEMVAEFRLEDVNSSPAFFDVKKLTSFNEHYLRAMPVPAFVEAAAPFMEAVPEYNPAVFEKIAPAVQQRARTLADVPNLVDFLFLEQPVIDEAAWAKAVVPNKSILEDAATTFQTVAWDAESIHAAAADIATAHEMSLGKAQAPIRVAVTGRTVGPPLFESLEVLGRDRTLARVTDALARLQ